MERSQGQCHECEALGVPVMVVGAPLEWESPTARVCEKCLRKALKRLNPEACHIGMFDLDMCARVIEVSWKKQGH